jgi:hypothetical protein
MSETRNFKRPASHRWAIGLLAFMTAGFILLLFDLFRGRSGKSPDAYWGVIAILSVGALALAALVLGKQRRWAYYLSAGSLAIWAGRGLYTVSLFVYDLLSGGSSLSSPYFHLAERDKPFVVQQHVPWDRQLLLTVTVGLLVWLFVRFTFGRPSRIYYGFQDAEKK